MPELADHRTITVEANGLAFACLETGPSDGPLALCLHGFPDTPHTWFYAVAPALAELGMRVVAPYLRGYAPTTAPDDARYGVGELGDDTLALLDALDAERAVLIGHDWGASGVYSAAARAPERVLCGVTFDIPHAAALRPSLRMLWMMRHFLSFQLKERAVRWVERDDFQGIEAAYRRWSPRWDFDAAELAPVKTCFAQPGTTRAALGYYWTFRQDMATESGRAAQRHLRARMSVPWQLFGGELAPKSAFHGSRRFFTGPFDLQLLPCGHWPHRELPERVVEQLVLFLHDHV